ncbi:ATP-dependent RNA helicase-like protein DB10 [Aristolochia californica]|uniref:ATP-dependent RNA helicase-like protein DB10 n=1 Tax=Aristolochia californica TaxID=171875 RepID=UPI0035DAF19E
MAATASASSSGPRYAPHDPTLPNPWKGLVDGNTGYLYFWNPETNVTQYERPGSSSFTGPAVPKTASISSSIHIQQSSGSPAQAQQKRNDEDNRYNGVSNGGAKPVAAPASRSHQGSRINSHLQDFPNGSISGGSNAYNSGSSGQISKSTARQRGPADVGSASSVESYCLQHEITISGDDVPAPFMTFESTGFPSEILKEVHHAGFSAPTPIQAQTWPIALRNRDIVAIAKTGSGKTLGYLIPAFIHLKRLRNNSQMGPTVLVLSPTRELATQIQDEAVKFSRSSRISCTCLYGGAPKGPQLRDIDRGTDVVVATPGRLNDILEMRRISLRQVSYLVLDEADRMLDMGFEPQIRKIVKEIPTRRQTLMYTATWPKEVCKIAADLLINPVQVNIGKIDELVANKSITQYIEIITPMEKQRRLEQILRSLEPGSKVIIFCSTKRMCEQLSRTLTRTFGAAAIHGDKSQGERDYVLSQFRTGRSPVLVATDVAARGLDIKDIRIVFNYDFPTGIEDYVHRIGRTGRAGATGVAHTFFCEQDAKYASDLIKVLEGAGQRVPPELRDMGGRGGGRLRRPWGSGAGGGGGRDGGRTYGGGRNESSFGGRGGRGAPSSAGGWSDRGLGGRGRNHWDDRDRYDRGGHYDDARGRYDISERQTGDKVARVRSRSRSFSPRPKSSGWGAGNNSPSSKSRNCGHSRSRSRSLDRFSGGPQVNGRSPGSVKEVRSPIDSEDVRGNEPPRVGGSPRESIRLPRQWGKSPSLPPCHVEGFGDGVSLPSAVRPESHYRTDEDEEGMIPLEEDGVIIP